MIDATHIDPIQVCEDLLAAEISYNIEHQILPSEIAVARQMLARRPELREVYEELYGKLHKHPPALKAFFGLVLSAAVFWHPDEIAQARDARAELVQINRAIGDRASELADLLNRRSEVQNSSGFTTGTHYHVGDVLIAAATDIYLFNSYVRPKLELLRSQFDLKYWPTLGDFLQVLSEDAAAADPQALDPMTAAATSGLRASLADFFKALFAAIEENASRNYGPLPFGFKVSDSSLASLANCVLGLDPDRLVDASYVKRLRQREREERG